MLGFALRYHQGYFSHCYKDYRMKVALHGLLSLTLLLSTLVFADGHTPSEATVKTAIETYWEARNTSDAETVAAMESQTGFLGTNSDGSFHKPMSTASADDWEKNMVGNNANLRVVYPETTEIADGVVYARYYAEGVVGTNDNVSPYRTRVTSVWLKESDGEWRVKSMHFSPANYGGTHKTQSSDFDD